MLVTMKQTDFPTASGDVRYYGHFESAYQALKILNYILFNCKETKPQNGCYDSAIPSTPRYTFKRINSMCLHKNLHPKFRAVLIMITQSGNHSHI